ncbi:hypothetical protein V6N11_048541 [Hibiscus sabdariffa]|uniref:RNase H type-1 domain-containing protein n=1 Tax=Hibiscus sabdariffa TaxID=183260 RepID=A0ABR2PW77_9ROSI
MCLVQSVVLWEMCAWKRIGLLLLQVGIGAHSNLINHVHKILRRDWEITFTHIFREANTIVDLLAKMDTSGHVDGCIFGYPPSSARDLVLHEIGLISPTSSSLVLPVGVT